MNGENNNIQNQTVQNEQKIANEVELEPVKVDEVFEELTIPEEPKQVVLETAPVKNDSNFGLIIVVILLVLSVIYIDDIITFVQSNILTTNPIGVGPSNGDNLVDGYLILNDTTASAKVGSIKFYNFKKHPKTLSVSLNYVSDFDYKDVSTKLIFIEFYNSEKEMIYRYLFSSPQKVEKFVVRTYTIELDEELYNEAYFANIKIHSESDVLKSTKLSCTYENSNDNYKEKYKRDYIFKNDMLVSYSVNKSVEVIKENSNSKKVLDNLKKENEGLMNAGISSTYKVNSLLYNVNLVVPNDKYVPIYIKNTSSDYIKNKEVAKKWICE